MGKYDLPIYPACLTNIVDDSFFGKVKEALKRQENQNVSTPVHESMQYSVMKNHCNHHFPPAPPPPPPPPHDDDDDDDDDDDRHNDRGRV